MRFANVCLAALLLAVATPAYAQMAFDQIGKSGRQQAPAKEPPPPPALPGAEGKGRGAAPPTKSPLDMEPNAELFDAINRGDIAAARDALSRGADLHARNVLGMSPLELSIDLGRNDISFMLLSMRNAEDSGKPKQAAASPAVRPASVKQAKQVPVRATSRVADSVPAPAPSQTARLFSGDGGTPNPNAGFLGFDSARR
jgi:hypothetical protein